MEFVPRPAGQARARSATRTPATRRARASASPRASNEWTARAGSCSSVSSITAAMSRNASWPARKAWTATSLAALSVQGAVPPARPASRARRSAENVSRSGASKVSAPSSTRSSGSHRHVHPIGIVQRVGDRHPHVRVAEVGEGRAVAQLHEAVDDRLGVHDDVDLLVRRPEQVVGLDHLKALVHQRRRVDRDLAAHRPRRDGRAPARP